MDTLFSCCTTRDSKAAADAARAAEAPEATGSGANGAQSTGGIPGQSAPGVRGFAQDGAAPRQRKWTAGWLPDEVAAFWQDNRENFITWWKKTRPQERVAILRKINPNMPTRPGDDFINGQYVGVASRLCPELSIDTLVKNQGTGLIELFDERTSKVEEAQEHDATLVGRIVVDGVVEGVSVDKLAQERETRILQHLALIAHVFRQREEYRDGKNIWTDLAANGTDPKTAAKPKEQDPGESQAPWRISSDANFGQAKPWSIQDDMESFHHADKEAVKLQGQQQQEHAARQAIENPIDKLIAPDALTAPAWTPQVDDGNAQQQEAARMLQLQQMSALHQRMAKNNGYLNEDHAASILQEQQMQAEQQRVANEQLLQQQQALAQQQQQQAMLQQLYEQQRMMLQQQPQQVTQLQQQQALAQLGMHEMAMQRQLEYQQQQQQVQALLAQQQQAQVFAQLYGASGGSAQSYTAGDLVSFPNQDAGAMGGGITNDAAQEALALLQGMKQTS